MHKEYWMGCVIKTMEVAMLMYAWYEEERGEFGNRVHIFELSHG